METEIDPVVWLEEIILIPANHRLSREISKTMAVDMWLISILWICLLASRFLYIGCI